MSAKKSSTDILQDAFPGRVAISPKEAARAIYGEGMDTKKRVERVRNELDAGTWPYFPGARKKGKRWMIPIAALGAAMDQDGFAQEQASPTFPPASTGRRSKHASIGPRPEFQSARAREIWVAIFWELDSLASEAEREALAGNTQLAAGGTSGRF